MRPSHLVGFVTLFVVCAVGTYLVINRTTHTETVVAAKPEMPTWQRSAVIGRSVQGREIKAYTYGNGEKHLVFVGGMHGGYEWNSVLLAYRFMDYLDSDRSAIPNDLKVTVIPDLNPDGVYKVVGKEGRFSETDIPKGDASSGRFNTNQVDLNRNFDCRWQPTGTWKGNTVSAGSKPFSEPEARALRDFTLASKPTAFVFWHSKANAVYASECEEGILPLTLDIMRAYASAAEYTAIDAFDAYPVTGDAEGWLASIGVPAITVELSSHESVEWDKNLKGVQALFRYFDQGSARQ